MKWADLRAEYSKTQGEIGAIKWQIGVLLAAAAGAGSSVSGLENPFLIVYTSW